MEHLPGGGRTTGTPGRMGHRGRSSACHTWSARRPQHILHRTAGTRARRGRPCRRHAHRRASAGTDLCRVHGVLGPQPLPLLTAYSINQIKVNHVVPVMHEKSLARSCFDISWGLSHNISKTWRGPAAGSGKTNLALLAKHSPQVPLQM